MDVNGVEHLAGLLVFLSFFFKVKELIVGIAYIISFVFLFIY